MAKYIKMETALKVVEKYGLTNGSALGRHTGLAICIASEIAEIPAADVAPVVHGRWEQDADGDWYCTNCDEVVAICESGRERTYRKPYCPNCGAKMDGKEVQNADDHD